MRKTPDRKSKSQKLDNLSPVSDLQNSFCHKLDFLNENSICFTAPCFLIKYSQRLWKM